MLGEGIVTSSSPPLPQADLHFPQPSHPLHLRYWVALCRMSLIDPWILEDGHTELKLIPVPTRPTGKLIFYRLLGGVV